MFDKKKNAAESYGVIGLGRFGTALVKTLAAAGKEVIAVDKDEAKVKAVRGYTDYAFVIDELDETSLKETGMQNCGTVTICIGEQIDISILTTMLVTKLGVPHVISKAASEVHGEVLKRLGAEVVYPEADMAVRIGKRLISGTSDSSVEPSSISKTSRSLLLIVWRSRQSKHAFKCEALLYTGTTTEAAGWRSEYDSRSVIDYPFNDFSRISRPSANSMMRSVAWPSHAPMKRSRNLSTSDESKLSALSAIA